MEVTLKKPCSFDEQVLKLKEHGMTIKNEERAKAELQSINYYRFTGYALSFRLDPTGKKYIPGTDFDTILELYHFDEALRDVIRLPLERIEIFARTQISYWFSIKNNMDPPHAAHYDRAYFYNQEQYDDIIDRTYKKEEYHSDSLFVKHHIEKYENKMPLWVMVEIMSFNDLVKFYNAMWNRDKYDIAKSMNASNPALLKNHLLCMNKLRNKCAHASRLFGSDIVYNPPAQLHTHFLKKNPSVRNNTLFAYLLILIKRQPNITYKQQTADSLKAVLKTFEGKFNPEQIGLPSNYEYILDREIK